MVLKSEVKSQCFKARKPQRCTRCARLYERKHTCGGRDHRKRHNDLIPDSDDKVYDHASAHFETAVFDRHISLQLNGSTAYELFLNNAMTYLKNSCKNKKLNGRGTLITPNGDDTTDKAYYHAVLHIKLADFTQHITQQLNRSTAYELLIHTIMTYFRNACQNMKFDDRGTLITPNGAKLRNDYCTEFDSYFFTATMLFRKKRFKDYHFAVSKACQLVEQIIRAEHPRTLACFFEVFIHLTQNGFHETALRLCNYISTVSFQVFQERHPWGHILWLLCKLDPLSFQPAIERAWECITDTCDDELSSTSPLAVSIRLDYVKRVYRSTDPLKEQRLLEKLLGTLEKQGGHELARLAIPRVMLNSAHNMERQKNNLRAETFAQRASQLLKDTIYSGKDAEKIECLKIQAHNQFERGCRVEAEKNMKAAISMIMDKMGLRHPWVYEFTTVLEQWYQSWGRVTESEVLSKDIQKGVGQAKDNKFNPLL
jgi:hypothetical protein